MDVSGWRANKGQAARFTSPPGCSRPSPAIKVFDLGPPPCKPVSVPRRAAIIHLGETLLPSSSNLPGSRTERAAPPPLFGLAPHGVCPARQIAPSAVRSYRTFSPLPKTGLAPHPRRYIFCGTFREIRFERTPPAVSRHAALWRPDFPPANRFPDPRATTRTTGPTQLSQKATIQFAKLKSASSAR